MSRTSQNVNVMCKTANKLNRNLATPLKYKEYNLAIRIS